MPIPGNNLRDNLFMTPLYRCPWCKTDITSNYIGDGSWFIGCTNTECKIKPFFLAGSEREAIKVWNSCEAKKMWNPPIPVQTKTFIADHEINIKDIF